MKKILFIFLFASAISFSQKTDALFQYSTIGALMNGNYDGSLSFKELSSKGNFGIGTIDNLDGEMIALDGIFYQINNKGKVIEVSNDKETPFAIVTFFKVDKTMHLSDRITSAAMTALLNKLLEGTNYPVAIKITGEFENIKTRSVPPQKRPYPLLTEAVKGQSVFSYSNIKGTLVGFYFPKYFEGVNMPGYHFHFISDDRTKGGHVMDYIINNPKIMPNFYQAFNMQLLDKFEPGAALQIPKNNELEKVEK